MGFGVDCIPYLLFVLIGQSLELPEPTCDESNDSGGSECPDNPVNFTRYRAYGRDTCLFLDREKMPWAEARKSCQNYGGDLPKLEDTVDYNYIGMFVKSQKHAVHAWVGLHQDEDDKKYYWLDDKKPDDNPRWDAGHPRFYYKKQKCAFMAKGKRFRIRSQHCTSTKDTVCQHKSGPSLKQSEPTCDESTVTDTDITDDRGDSGDSACPEIPVNFTRYRAYGRDTCLFLDREKMPWAEARKSCQKYGGDLPKLKDTVDYNYIGKFVKSQEHAVHAWVGLHQDEKDKKYYWLDDNEPEEQPRWDAGHPRFYYKEQKCAFMTKGKSFLIRSQHCTSTKDSVCQHKLLAGSIKTSRGPKIALGHTFVIAGVGLSVVLML